MTARAERQEMSRARCPQLQGSKRTLRRASMPRLAQTTSCSGGQSFSDQRAPSGTEVGLRFGRGLAWLDGEAALVPCLPLVAAHHALSERLQGSRQRLSTARHLDPRVQASSA